MISKENKLPKENELLRDRTTNIPFDKLRKPREFLNALDT
jgi:hypothetical protein